MHDKLFPPTHIFPYKIHQEKTGVVALDIEETDANKLAAIAINSEVYMVEDKILAEGENFEKVLKYKKS